MQYVVDHGAKTPLILYVILFQFFFPWVVDHGANLILHYLFQYLYCQ